MRDDFIIYITCSISVVGVFCYESIKYCLNVLVVAFFLYGQMFFLLFFHSILRTDCTSYIFMHATFNSNDIYIYREIFMHILEKAPFYVLKWVVDVYSPNRDVPTSKTVILNRESSTTTKF